MNSRDEGLKKVAFRKRPPQSCPWQMMRTWESTNWNIGSLVLNKEIMIYTCIYILIGGIPTPWKILVRLDHHPNYWGKKSSKPPTIYIYICLSCWNQVLSSWYPGHIICRVQVVKSRNHTTDQILHSINMNDVCMGPHDQMEIYGTLIQIQT
jgi:hypothetical protein